MSKPIKDLITNELKSRYAQLNSAMWVELTKVDGITNNAFRRALHGKQMRVEIVKNALFQRACEGGALAPLAKALRGPAALITGGDSLIDVAKALEEWLPKMPGLKLRGAVIEGEYVDEKGVGGVAKMPSKRDLQGRVAACALSPGGKLASAILAGGSNIAGCLKALIEKLEKGDAGAAGAAEAASAAGETKAE